MRAIFLSAILLFALAEPECGGGKKSPDTIQPGQNPERPAIEQRQANGDAAQKPAYTETQPTFEVEGTK